MTSLRKFVVSLTALGCAGLLGCSSGGESPAPALPPASVSASSSADASAPPATTGATAPVPAPGSGTATTGVPPAPAAAPNDAPAPNGAPGQATTAPKPPTVQPNPANPGTAPLPQLADPAQAVAAAGPKGQDYLKALRDRGVISNPALDPIYILFGQTTCQAEAKGTSRADILKEFAQIGPMLAPGSSLPPGQVSEVFVSAAEQILC